MLATRYQGSLVQEPRRLSLADGWREKSCRGGGLRAVASRKPQRAYRWPDSGACSAEAEQRGGCGRPQRHTTFRTDTKPRSSPRDKAHMVWLSDCGCCKRDKWQDSLLKGGSPHCNGRNAAREATRCKRAPQGTALPGEMAFLHWCEAGVACHKTLCPRASLAIRPAPRPREEAVGAEPSVWSRALDRVEQGEILYALKRKIKRSY
ncbi:hypothetical protein L1887_57025 [Cichorium endivia]|nr:hypothetical protein L1887_57025 [Cichorium endivia]